MTKKLIIIYLLVFTVLLIGCGKQNIEIRKTTTIEPFTKQQIEITTTETTTEYTEIETETTTEYIETETATEYIEEEPVWTEETTIYVEEAIEYYEEETSEYYEEETSEYYVEEVTYGSPRLYEPGYFKQMGILNWNGWQWTYYSQRVLPGGGLNIPGRYVDWDGYVCDENGYICLASSSLAWGTIVDTPLGKPGKVYDSGCDSYILDVYVDW